MKPASTQMPRWGLQDWRALVTRLAAAATCLHAAPFVAAAEALTSILISINSRYKTHGAGIRITGPDRGET